MALRFFVRYGYLFLGGQIALIADVNMMFVYVCGREMYGRKI